MIDPEDDPSSAEAADIRSQAEFRERFLAPREDARRRVEAEAHRLGISDTRKIVRAVEAESPVGRFILGLLDLPVRAPDMAPGRPRDDERIRRIVNEVEVLRRSGMPETQAFAQAAARLAKGSDPLLSPGNTTKPLSPARVRKVCRQWVARWFEPIPPRSE